MAGFADPRADSVADVPEAGEAALCLACFCVGADGEASAGVPMPVKRELAEA